MAKLTCMLCGEDTSEHKIKEVPFTYKGETIMIEQPGKWCDSCGEGVLNSEDRKATIKEMQTHKARVDGLLTPDEIHKIRTKLNLSQKKAGELFGGGINAFSRYERGEHPIPKAASGLLTILDNHPKQLKELQMPRHQA